MPLACAFSKDVKVPPPLSAQNKFSFAYKTIKERLPVILVKTIDFLHRQRKELHKFGGTTLAKPNEQEITEIVADAKLFISEITKLRKELETNKPLEYLDKISNLPLHLEYFNDDVELWNKALDEHKLPTGSMPLWFESPWLLVECYLYRKLKEMALKTKHLKMFDPFVEQKQAACRASLGQMQLLALHLKEVEKTIKESEKQQHPSERTELTLFLQLALWANKCDLSISGMSAEKAIIQKVSSTLRESVDELEEKILCNHLQDAWYEFQSIRDKVKRNSQEVTYIDIVLDNSGYELFVDLCLAYFLHLFMIGPEPDASKLKFRIHMKRMPWFVSDTMSSDVDWLLDLLKNEPTPALQELSDKWRALMDSKVWELHSDKFWTLPHDYSEMEKIAPTMYETIGKSSIVIFKGDLNYRKLVGDRSWNILTPFHVTLRGFGPTSVLALRTAKADVVVGIEDINIYGRVTNNELPRDWQISGEFGFIQLVRNSS